MIEDFYPNLKYFFSAYFHQFWTENDFEDIVVDFKDMETHTRVVDTCGELEHLINRNLNEEELHGLLFRSLGSYVRAPGLGLTYQSWLEAVLSILKEDD